MAGHIGDPNLLECSLAEIKSYGTREGMNLEYCSTKESAINDFLSKQHKYNISVVVDRSNAGSLGVTFGHDMGIEHVSGEHQGAKLGMGYLKDWMLRTIDGTPIPNTTVLVSIFAAKKGLTTMTFQRRMTPVKLQREYGEQNIGLTLSDDLIIESVRENSPAAAAGLTRFVGYKLAAIDDRLILEPQDLVNRTHCKKEFSFSVIKMHSRRHLHMKRRDPNEKFGVTFGSDLSVSSVTPNSLGERVGFGTCLTSWKIVSIDGMKAESTEDLVKLVTGKVTCLFVLGPVGGQEVQQKTTKNTRNTRDCTIIRKDGSESIGMFCNNDLVLELVTERSASDKAGLRDLIGWRITHIDGIGVYDKEVLKTQIGDKLSVTASLVLDDDNLPCSVVKVGLSEEKSMKDILNAFSRYGAVAQILPTERVMFINCTHCNAEIGLQVKFCSSCGGRVLSSAAPYFCHITFRRVDDAKRALADPPTNLPGLQHLRYYHPPKQENRVVEEDKEEAKPSLLSMARCLGFFNAFAILDVTKDATKEEIKKAFNEKSRMYHPDRRHLQTDTKDDNGEMFKAVAKAYKTLKDKEERANLDKEIEKAIQLHGKKQVMARIPTRGKKTEEVEEEVVEQQAPSVFSGYHTGEGQKDRPGYRDGLRCYTGLKSVEVLPSKVRPEYYDEYWEGEQGYSHDQQGSFDAEYDQSGSAQYDDMGVLIGTFGQQASSDQTYDPTAAYGLGQSSKKEKKKDKRKKRRRSSDSAYERKRRQRDGGSPSV
eukprot:TRINITY_DN30568_c0_g1_i1.p1 TRINITY_DN30568_c0_g1~~TRINITY_DN30568_c0_g1_i1.p1  ORF type:complete len:762 (+),score=177.46 TRINITY_DN30568_c0_g1_i1:223-2508(+)